MTFTDIITLLTCGLLIWLGYRRGFIRSVIGPLALVIALIAAFLYFQATKNMVVSLLISLFGPMAVNILLRIWLGTASMIKNPKYTLNSISRLAGAALTMSWGLVIWLTMILLLLVLPPVIEGVHMIKKDIHGSATYKIIKPYDLLADKPKVNADEAVQDLSADQRIQDIYNDPQLVRAIERKDYAYLMSNPKIIALTKDPAVVKKMLALYQELTPEQLKAAKGQ